jgi:ATP-dependent helicase STH1/SNF2
VTICHHFSPPLQVKVQKTDTGKKSARRKGQPGEAEAEVDGNGPGFERANLRNTDEVDIKALMKNKDTYYELVHTDKESVMHQPDMLVGGALRQYQMQGLKWLVSLYNNKLSGVLADEMGLGKTIQIIALIAHLMEVKKCHGPFLIVAPLSTIDNWVKEFESWTPALRKIVYVGPQETRMKLKAEALKGNFNVFLTTFEYAMARKKQSFLANIDWVYIIVDEGHRMKNSKSTLSKALSQKLNSQFRILITGTPLQNNLNELWSLLNFLLPKIFAADSNFETWFNTGNILGGGEESASVMDEEEKLLVIDRLHQVLRPFMLRRLKSDVEKDLKPKVEKVIKCSMSACQWRLYTDIRESNRMVTMPGAAGSAPSAARPKTLSNIVMELKKACNHPYLFWLHARPEVPCAEVYRASGKFELLQHVLPKLRAAGHRVLIFCQMTRLMEILGEFLAWEGHRFLRLDGSTDTATRGEMIEIFNSPASPYDVFLLSTRAGGLGLNLPAADTVIIFDSDWNPQADRQAQDRAHRIGQTREVRVLRLVCEGTVEEDILAKATMKQELGGAAIDGGMFNEQSTVEDRHDFLRRILQKSVQRQSHALLSRDALNRELARDPEELALFSAMDAREAAAAQRAGLPPRLIGEAEVPSWMKYEEEEKLSKVRRRDAERVEMASRKNRKRKSITYKEEDISHSSDVDSSDDEDEGNGSNAAQPAGGARRPGGADARSDEESSEDEGKGSNPALPQGAKGSKVPGRLEQQELPEAVEDGNNDLCELCQQGGEVVCCERCPAVYHAQCLGARMEDLPDEYICPKCTAPPPPPRTKRTRRVLHPVLTGYVSSLSQVHWDLRPCRRAVRQGLAHPGARLLRPLRTRLARRRGRDARLRRRASPAPPLPLVLSGHAASLTPY